MERLGRNRAGGQVFNSGLHHGMAPSLKHNFRLQHFMGFVVEKNFHSLF